MTLVSTAERVLEVMARLRRPAHVRYIATFVRAPRLELFEARR